MTAATILAAGLGFGLPAAASASTAPGALSAAGPQPDSSNFYIYTSTHERGTAHTGVCHAGAVYNSVNPVESVKNNCEYRVYLEQYKGGSHGWVYCVSPHSDANVVPGKYHAPRTIGVPDVKSKC